MKNIDNEIENLIKGVSEYFHDQANLIGSYGESEEFSNSEEIENIVMSLDKSVFIELVKRIMLLSMKVTKIYNTQGIMFKDGRSYEQTLDESKKRDDTLYAVENLFVNDNVGIVVSNFLLRKVSERLNKLDEFDVNQDWVCLDSYWEVFNKIPQDVEKGEDGVLKARCFLSDVRDMDYAHKVLDYKKMADEINVNIHNLYTKVLGDSLMPGKAHIKGWLAKAIAQEEMMDNKCFTKEYNVLDFLVDKKLKAHSQNEAMLLDSYADEIAEYIKGRRFESRSIFVKNIVEKHDFWESQSRQNKSFKSVHDILRKMLLKVESFNSIENTFIEIKNNACDNTVKIKVSLLKIGVANNINSVSGPISKKELADLKYSEHIYDKKVQNYIERNTLDRFGEAYLDLIKKAIKDIDSNWVVNVDKYPIGSYGGLKIIELTLSSENKENLELLLTLMGKAVGVVGEENGYEHSISPMIEEYVMKKELSQSNGKANDKKARLKKF